MLGHFQWILHHQKFGELRQISGAALVVAIPTEEGLCRNSSLLHVICTYYVCYYCSDDDCSEAAKTGGTM